MTPTRIEWTDESWNCVAGCTKVSPGCENCYALAMSWRIMNTPKHPARYNDVCGVGPSGIQWTGKVNLDLDALDRPLHWRKPRRVFVCSMSDLFHPNVSNWFILNSLFRMLQSKHHTFQVLTKRSARMQMFFTNYLNLHRRLIGVDWVIDWPFPNVWLGASIENQEWADKRTPDLLRTPAAIRFVSVEPMLEAIDFEKYLMSCEGCGNQGSTAYVRWENELCQRACPKAGEGPSLDWLIIGCESGPGRRPMELEWAIDLVGQCKTAHVPVFVKQIPINGKVSRDPSEWPVQLQVREYPVPHVPT